jgi:hypothetical protein
VAEAAEVVASETLGGFGALAKVVGRLRLTCEQAGFAQERKTLPLRENSQLAGSCVSFVVSADAERFEKIRNPLDT